MINEKTNRVKQKCLTKVNIGFLKGIVLAWCL